MHAVFDNLEQVEDVLTFGLTCRHIWPFARRRVCEWQRQITGPWAGENLVAVGNPCHKRDYPNGPFSAEEIDELEDRGVEEHSTLYDEPIIYQFDISSFSLWEVLQHVSMPEALPGQALARLYDNLIRQGRMDVAMDSVSHDLRMDQSAYVPANEDWILRNLTTKELVRAEAVAIKPELIRGPHIERRGFHHLLLV